MSTDIPKDQIKSIECRFAVYCPPPNGTKDDLHLVKEIIHTKDGRVVPNVRLLKNFQRPFWVTRKGHQNHESKKEWEDIGKLQEFKTTQTNLVEAAAKALEQPWFDPRKGLRKLARSPFLYGADILSTAVVKRMYLDQFPDTITPFNVATFDTETDVIHGTEEIVMATISYKDKVFTAIQKSFVEGYSDVIPRLHTLLEKYLSEYVVKRNIKWEVVVVENEIAVVKTVFQKAHDWKPDFFAIWNMDFDIPKVVKAIERAGMEPKDIFSDPSVPREYRFYEYKQGPAQKVTASGKVTPIKPAARWHTVLCPSSFYVIDAMCAYRHIRTGQPEEASYSLDSILNLKLGIRKLKFQEAEGKVGLGWHQFMQSRHPLEYTIYNVFDCVSMEELDELTRDLSLSLPMMSGCSDFMNFKSQPRRVVDDLHYFALKNNDRVIATTSDQMAEELDEMTIGLKDWIVMLPAHQVADNGLKVIAEYPDLRTNIRRDVGDLDVAASYPNGGAVFNISRETTAKELVKIEGIDEYTQRAMGVNLCGGATNAVEFCTNMFGLPPLNLLLEEYRKTLGR